MEEQNVRWNVTLSTGESFSEGKGEFSSFAGEKSPWNKLQDYLKQNNSKIVSLFLSTADNNYYLVKAGDYPNFSPFRSLKEPIEYSVKRYFAQTAGQENELCTVAIAIYQDYELQLWVDERNTKNSWVLVK